MKTNRKKRDNCPFCKPATCPFCDRPVDPWRESQCVLNQPLMMVIPPGGVHLDCPVHPAGHHIFGNQITCKEPEIWKAGPSKYPLTFDSSYRPVEYDSSQRIVEYDSTRPWRSTGDNIF